MLGSRRMLKLLEDIATEMVTLSARMRVLESTYVKALQVQDSEMVKFLKGELQEQKALVKSLLGTVVGGTVAGIDLPPVDLKSLGLALPGEEVESGSPSAYVDDFELAGEISGSAGFHDVKKGSGGEA